MAVRLSWRCYVSQMESAVGISDEENSKFQGIFMPIERAVYTYSNIVKILILTKGVETEFKKNVRKADCRNISYM